MLSRRVAKLVLALLLVAPLGAWVVLRVSLLIKVREAKALLSQVKALRVRESTFQDAKRLADQYNGKVEDHWKTEDRSDPCTFENCKFMISLGTWPDRQPGLLKEALRFVGIRAYGVEGAVGVRNGRVIGTEFGVTTEATPGSVGGQWIAAVAKISDRFSQSDYSRGHRLVLDDHPNREVIHPHFTTTGGGQIILSEVTADANAVEKDRAFDFRFSCISGLRGCSELRELAPSAWEDLTASSSEQEEQLEESIDYGECSRRSLARIARDLDNVLLVEVRRAFPIKKAEDRLQDVELQLIEVRKGQPDKHLSRFPLEVPEADPAASGRSSRLPNTFSPANQFLLFLKEGEFDFIPDPHCEVVPASRENLAVVRQTLTQLEHGVPITALADGHQRP